MKLRHLLLALLSFARLLTAGEAMLTTTYQPLDGLGSGTIKIVAVTCHDWYSLGSDYTAIGLIGAANVPPTNNPKEAKDDLNIASVCGLKFTCDEEPKVPVLTLDLTSFTVPEEIGHSREDIVKSSLECLRRCLPKALKKVPVTLNAKAADKPWAEKIVNDFNARDRNKVFFTPEE
jgi:hypothetical protein